MSSPIRSPIFGSPTSSVSLGDARFQPLGHDVIDGQAKLQPAGLGFRLDLARHVELVVLDERASHRQCREP